MKISVLQAMRLESGFRIAPKLTVNWKMIAEQNAMLTFLALIPDEEKKNNLNFYFHTFLWWP